MNNDQREIELNCETHGKMTVTQYFVAGKWLDPYCPKCADEKAAAAEKEQETLSEYQEQASKQNAIEANIGRAMIPTRFKKHSFESYNLLHERQTTVFNVCKDYAEKFDEAYKLGRCMMLCGKTGTGKTHLACSIANHILQQGNTALFMGVLEAVRSVKQTFNQNSEITEQEAIDWFLNPDLLILDEVGVQFGTDTEKLILFEIINKRYEEMKPSILLSNLTPKELNAFVGDRVMDRMKENSGKIINFDWSSHREVSPLELH